MQLAVTLLVIIQSNSTDYSEIFESVSLRFWLRTPDIDSICLFAQSVFSHRSAYLPVLCVLSVVPFAGFCAITGLLGFHVYIIALSMPTLALLLRADWLSDCRFL